MNRAERPQDRAHCTRLALLACMVREACNRSAPFILGGAGEPARQNVCIHLSCNIWVVLIWYLVDTNIISGWYSGGYGQDCYVLQPFLLRHKTPCSSALFSSFFGGVKAQQQRSSSPELPSLATQCCWCLIVHLLFGLRWSPPGSSGFTWRSGRFSTFFHFLVFVD